MIRKALVFTLVMALANGAGAAVVWNWTGDANDGLWESTFPLSNWSVTGSTGWAYPSAQYSGVPVTEGPPDYRYINDDVTAINIANGDTVNKDYEDYASFTASARLFMGGNDCVLTLDNGSTLHLGGDFNGGVGAGTHATVNLLNGATLSTDYAYCGDGGTCTVNISGGASFTPRNGSRLGWNGGTGYMNIDGGTFDAVNYSFRLGGNSADAVPVGGYAELDVQNGGTVAVTTNFRVGSDEGSSAVATFDASTLEVGTTMYAGSNGTATVELKNGTTATVGGDIRVGSSNTATMTVTGGSTLDVSDTIFVGRNETGNGTLNVSGAGTVVSSLGVGGDSGYNRLAVGYSGMGVVNVTAGGKISVVEDIYVGDQKTGTGTLNVSGAGSLVETTVDQMIVARNGDAVGTLNISAGGAVSIADDLYVAYGDNTQGTVSITGTGSSLTIVGDDMMVSRNDGSSATVTVSNGGELDIQGDSLGFSGGVGSVATMNVESGGVVSSTGRTYIGYGGQDTGGTATVNVTGATMNVGTDLRLAYGSLAKGNLNVYTGGLLNVGRDLETSVGGDVTAAATDGMEANIHVYDGEVNINGYLALACSSPGGCVAEFIMDDGEVNVGLDPPEFDPPREFLDNLFMGWYDTDAEAYLTINGGTMTVAGAISMGSEYNYDGTPITTTGADLGMLRITIDGGVLQAEDYVDAGTFSDHLITFTEGELRINGSAVSEAAMANLITSGDIVCTGTYYIYSSAGYTVLSDSTSIVIPGDTNGDGHVNNADAANMAANWGSSVTPGDFGSGDFNNDGVVDMKDASILAANWGDHTSSESTSAVPEPSILILLMALVPVALLRRARR